MSAPATSGSWFSSDLLHKLTLGLFHFLLFTVPFVFTFVNEELFEFNKMILVYGITVLIATLWAARSILEKKILFKTTPLDFVIFFFFGTQLLATIFSMHLHTSIFGYYTRFHGGLLSTLSYIILYFAFVATVSKKHIPLLLLTLLVGAAGAAVYAIPERFGASPSCWLLSGEWTTDCWSESTNPKYRIFGTFGQPNWLAAYLITLLPLSASLAFLKSQSHKWLYAGITLLLLLAVIFTNSRSGFLGLAMGGVVLIGSWVYLLRKQAKTVRAAISVPVGAGISVVGLSAVLFFGTPYSSSLTELRSTQSTQAQETPTTQDTAPINRLEVGGSDSGEIRKIVWTGALDVWKRYPLLGSGVETFAYSYYQDRPVTHNTVSEWDFLYNKAHNEFLNFLATTGLLGLAGYLAMLGMAALITVKLLRAKAQTLTEKSIAVSILAGLTALSVSNFFGFSTVAVSVVMFVFFGVLAVLVTSDEPPSRPHPKLVWWQYGLLVLVSLVGLHFLNRVHNYWSADYAFASGKKAIRSGQLDEGLQLLTSALHRSPNEPQYYNELAEFYAQVAIQLVQTDNSTEAAKYATAALAASEQALALNPRHLNFYKSRTQVLIRLSQLDPALIQDAIPVLEAARSLSPTDPKLLYTQALIEESLDNPDKTLELLEKAAALRPEYYLVRLKLGRMYLERGELETALKHFEYLHLELAPDDPISAELFAQTEASLSAQAK